MLWLYLTTVHGLFIVNRILYLSNSHSCHHGLSISSVIVIISLRHGKPPILSNIDSVLLWTPFEISSSIKCREPSIPTRAVPQTRASTDIHLDTLILLHLIYCFGPFRDKRFKLWRLWLLNYLGKKDSWKLRIYVGFLFVLSLILLLRVPGTPCWHFWMLY